MVPHLPPRLELVYLVYLWDRWARSTCGGRDVGTRRVGVRVRYSRSRSSSTASASPSRRARSPRALTLTGVPSRSVSASRASKASMARRVASTRRVKLARRASTSSTAARDAGGERARRTSSCARPEGSGSPSSSGRAGESAPRVEPEGLHAALAGASARVPNTESDTIPRARHPRRGTSRKRARRRVAWRISRDAKTTVHTSTRSTTTAYSEE